MDNQRTNHVNLIIETISIYHKRHQISQEKEQNLNFSDRNFLRKKNSTTFSFKSINKITLAEHRLNDDDDERLVFFVSLCTVLIGSRMLTSIWYLIDVRMINSCLEQKSDCQLATSFERKKVQE